jgi:hypothetical protein
MITQRSRSMDSRGFGHSMIRRCRMLSVSAMACSLLCGCQFSPTIPIAKWPWSEEVPAEVPERVLAVWSDSVLHQPGQPGVRGFGGRVYFYHTEANDPVKVDGGLAVYVFDADEMDPYNQKPLGKYVFTADQFDEHYSSSALGPSYSVWLPFDEVGGEARRLSLITRFEGREGGTVISEPAIKLLPGIPRTAQKDSNSQRASTGQIRAVGHQTQTSKQLVSSEALGGRAVQTIDLPPSFNQRLHSGVNHPQSSPEPIEHSREGSTPPANQPSGIQVEHSQQQSQNLAFPISDPTAFPKQSDAPAEKSSNLINQPSRPEGPTESSANGRGKPSRDLRSIRAISAPR